MGETHTINIRGGGGGARTSILFEPPGNCRPMVSKVTVTTSSSNPLPEHAPFSGCAVPTINEWELVLLQPNVEGIFKAKLEFISHMATENKATTILLQEMHATRPDLLTILGYSLVEHTISDSYGIATSSLTQPSGTRSPSHNLAVTSSGLSGTSRESTSPTFTSRLELASSQTPYHATHHFASTLAFQLPQHHLGILYHQP